MLLEAEQVAVLTVLLLRLLGVLGQVEDLEAEILTDLSVVEAVASGVLDRDLTLRIVDFLHDRHELIEVDVPRFVAEAGLELTSHPERALGGRQDGLLHRLDQHGGIDALLLADLLDDALQRHTLLHIRHSFNRTCRRRWLS